MADSKFKNINTLGGKNEDKNIIQNMLKDLSDEYCKRVFFLTPLNVVKMENIPTLNEIFSYLSITRNLEADSEKLVLLQEYLNRLIENTPILKARIILLKKGKCPEVFMAPDQTIFINQALINLMYSVEEIVGVIAHQAGRLIKGTFDPDQVKFIPDKIGRDWLKDLEGGSEAPVLLKKIGLNPDCFTSAVSKLINYYKNYEEDIINDEVINEYAKNNYKVENNLIPPAWKTDRIPETNLEIVRDIMLLSDTIDQRIFSEAIAKLNLIDLKLINLELENSDLIEGFEITIARRLHDCRYSDKEIKIFLIGLNSFRSKNPLLRYSLSDLTKISSEILHLEDSGRIKEMNNIIFENPNYFSPAVTFSSYINNYISKYNSGDDDLLLKDKDILKILDILNKTKLKSESDINLLNSNINNIIRGYLQYLRNTNSIFAKKINKKDFVDKINELGIAFADNDEKIDIEEDSVEIKSNTSDEFRSYFNNIIASFVNTYSINNAKEKSGKSLHKFFEEIRLFFEKFKIKNKERERYIREIIKLFDGYNDASQISLFSFLNGEIAADNLAALKIQKKYGDIKLTEKEKIYNQKICKYNFKILTVINLFDSDDSLFYELITEIMNNSGLDIKEFSKNQILNLCHPLLEQKYYFNSDLKPGGKYHIYGFNFPEIVYFNSLADIKNHAKLMKLPFIKEFYLRNSDLRHDSTIRDLFEYSERLKNTLSKFYNFGIKNSLFSENIISLIAFDEIKNTFLNLLNRNIRSSNLENLQNKECLFYFIFNNFYISPQITQILKEIATELLVSELTLNYKIEFLKRNFDVIGIEGLYTVANQIKNFTEFTLFNSLLPEQLKEYFVVYKKKSYLEKTDHLISELTDNFETVLLSCSDDPIDRQQVVAYMLEKWLDLIFSTDLMGTVEFSNTTGKMMIKDNSTGLFLSPADTVHRLINLPSFKKNLILIKALNRNGGAFSSLENRKKLAGILIKLFNIKDDFIVELLNQICAKADKEDLSHLLGRLFSYKLFNNLDINIIDYRKFGKLFSSKRGFFHENRISDEQLKTITTSTTSGILDYGLKYRLSPDSLLFKFATENKNEFFETYALLEKKFTVKEKPVSNLNNNIEDLIKFIEVSGVFGLRVLHLAEQLFPISSELKKKIYNVRNCKLDNGTFLLWKNLYEIKYAYGEEAELADFIQNKLQSVVNKISEDGLYTTFLIKVKDNTGSIVDSLAYVLNKDEIYDVENYYKLFYGILENMEKNIDKQNEEKIENTIILIDLVKEWILKEVNNPLYIQDDNGYRLLIDSLNNRMGGILFNLPQRLFVSRMIKVESKVTGRTLKDYLSDKNITKNNKHLIVKRLFNLFEYEYSHPIMGGQRGKRYLMTSDPSFENFIISNEEKTPVITIVNRHMYLNITETEANMLKGLWTGNHVSFLTNLINMLLDDNRIINPNKKKEVKYELISEVKSLITNNTDFYLLFKSVNKRLRALGMTIPLKIHLGIRKYLSFRNLESNIDGV